MDYLQNKYLQGDNQFHNQFNEFDAIKRRLCALEGSIGTMNRVLVDPADTLPGYLFSKLTPGNNISLSVLNVGGAETIKIDASGIGIQNFIQLHDVPNSYTGFLNNIVRVNTAQTGLEFHALTAQDVGLGSVNNTADLDKPISNATQVALNLKADKITTILASGNGITGGGDLSANRTVSLNFTYLDGRYILNSTTQQPTSNFNISGAGIIGTTLSVGSYVTTNNGSSVGGNGALLLNNNSNLRATLGLKVVDGVNSGSNLFLYQYLDNGTAVPVFDAVRATGAILFGNTVSIGSVPALGTAATTFLTTNVGVVSSRTPAQVLSDIGAAPISGGSGYIQNTTVQQPTSNFNISGVGVIGTRLSFSTTNFIISDSTTSTGGTYNVMLGTNTGFGITKGFNVFIGGFAGSGGLINGFGGHTGLGYSTLSSLIGNSTTDNNTAVGNSAGAFVTTGAGNAMFGANSGGPIVAGSHNLLLEGGSYQGTLNYGDVSSNIILATGNPRTIYAQWNASKNLTLAGNITISSIPALATAATTVLTNTSGLIQSRTLAQMASDLGTTNVFILNQTTQQGSSNFNISGTGITGGDMTIHTLTVGLGGGAVATNTVVGYQALPNGTLTGGSNVVVGYQAGFSTTTTASGNTLIGTSAGRGLTTGTDSTFVGNSAGYSATTGTQNTGIGEIALQNVAGGVRNVAVGLGAASNLAMNDVVALGWNAGKGISGQSNISIGSGSMLNASGAGGSNIVIGYNAAQSLTGGSNILIGAGAGGTFTTGNNNVIVGAYSGLAATTSNSIALADGQGNLRVYIPISGNVLIGTTTDSGYALDVQGTGRYTGTLTASILALATTATTFLTHTAGLIQSRTSVQVLSDIGATLQNVTTLGNTSNTGIQLTENGNVAASYGLFIKRNTDTSPLGWLIQATNSTGASNLFSVDVIGNVVTVGTYTGNLNNSLTFNNSGIGAASGTIFNNGASQTISYNTIGASPAVGTTFVSQETPSGLVNGTNTTYTLAFTPINASNGLSSLHLYKNGRLLKITNDYTLAGLTITMVTAPVSPDTLLATYYK